MHSFNIYHLFCQAELQNKKRKKDAELITKEGRQDCTKQNFCIPSVNMEVLPLKQFILADEG